MVTVIPRYILWSHSPKASAYSPSLHHHFSVISASFHHFGPCSTCLKTTKKHATTSSRSSKTIPATSGNLGPAACSRHGGLIHGSIDYDHYQTFAWLIIINWIMIFHPFNDDQLIMINISDFFFGMHDLQPSLLAEPYDDQKSISPCKKVAQAEPKKSPRRIIRMSKTLCEHHVCEQVTPLVIETNQNQFKTTSSHKT